MYPIAWHISATLTSKGIDTPAIGFLAAAMAGLNLDHRSVPKKNIRKTNATSHRYTVSLPSTVKRTGDTASQTIN
jgi:hypothetical protein